MEMMKWLKAALRFFITMGVMYVFGWFLFIVLQWPMGGPGFWGFLILCVAAGSWSVRSVPGRD